MGSHNWAAGDQTKYMQAFFLECQQMINPKKKKKEEEKLTHCSVVERRKILKASKTHLFIDMMI